MDLFDIAAKITLNTSDYEKGLAGADKQGSTFAEKLKKGLGTAAKVGGAAITAVGAGVVTLGKQFVSGVSDLASYGDQIDKNSQKMGISAQAYQEWDFILQHSGSSIDAMSRGMMTLSKQASSNSDAFKKLGISTEDLATLNKEDLFSKTIEGLQAMGEGFERDALAQELFGQGAKELGPLLNTSADDVAAMRKQINDLGGVMSNKAVKDAAAFQDSIQNLKTVVSGLKRSFLSEFLPSVTKVSDGLTKLFSGNKLEGLEDIKAGIKEFVDNISEMAPEFIEIGWSLIESLLQAINDNLPMLIERGADILLNGIIPGIIENLPALIETAFSVIAQLATSIGEALPELIPAAISMIIQIVESLLDNIDLLIDAALALIMGLAEGLIKAIPKLVEKAPEIVVKLVSAIIRNAPKLFEAAGEIIMKLGEGIADLWETVKSWGKDVIDKIWNGIKSTWESIKNWGRDIIDQVWSGLKGAINDAVQWGKDLISNFWAGIKSKLEWLWNKVKSVGQGIKDYLGFSEPKKGPLSNFHTFAPDMMELFAKGIIDNKKMLVDTVSNAFDFRDLMTAPEGAFGDLPSASAGGNTPIFGGGEIKLYIDGDTLVGATSEKMDRNLGDMQEIRARWGGRN